jgi:lysophospholipase L1-like esterase
MERMFVSVGAAVLLLLVPFALLARGAAAQEGSTRLRYVAIGASDAVGVGAPDPTVQGWVPRLAGLLGPDTQVTNLGTSGSLLHQALTEQLPAAVAADPDVVTVWLAVNDFNARVPLESYQADLDTLLGTLRDQTHAQVLVGNVPDLSLVAVYAGLDPALLRAEVGRWNAAIATTAAQHGATLVDLHGYWAELARHPEYVAADGFHPSAAGYARLAEVFYLAARAEADAA